jgi:hypothetical protein
MDEDGVLEQQLRRAVARFDPVPPQLVTAAIHAYAWRTIDAELAQLVVDSMISAATVRGPGEARLLTFETERLTIEVEVSSSSGIWSTGSSAVAQHTPSGERPVDSRATGRDRAPGGR